MIENFEVHIELSIPDEPNSKLEKHTGRTKKPDQDGHAAPASLFAVVPGFDNLLEFNR